MYYESKKKESAMVNQNQMFVTDYYEIVDKLDMLLYLENENKSLLLSFNNIKELNLLNLMNLVNLGLGRL